MKKDNDIPSVRERAMDAAATCFQSLGLGKTSMEAVAQQGGMSRATLYRHFSNRDELAIAVIEREALQVATQVQQRIGTLQTIEDYIVEGVVEACKDIAASAILNSLLEAESIGSSGQLLLMTNRLTNIGIDIVKPMIEPAQQAGIIRDDVSAEVIMDWILRIVISLLTIPGKTTSTDDKKRALLKAMLLPALLKQPIHS
ncbi:MAG: TetR/AcrR family transcriptional regulator [Halioglobus sp.]